MAPLCSWTASGQSPRALGPAGWDGPGPAAPRWPLRQGHARRGVEVRAAPPPHLCGRPGFSSDSPMNWGFRAESPAPGGRMALGGASPRPGALGAEPQSPAQSSARQETSGSVLAYTDGRFSSSKTHISGCTVLGSVTGLSPVPPQCSQGLQRVRQPRQPLGRFGPPCGEPVC